MSRPALAMALVAFVASAWGCQPMRQVFRPALEPRPSEMQNTEIDYVDTDGFDAIFETALVNRDAVVTVRTPNQRPDWTGRLNAWIAAWNMGKSADSRRFRGQFPSFSSLDGDTIREFRLLVNSVVDRADDTAKLSVNWFREERVRSRRIELLKPYNLRFHMHTDGNIHLIFFHGDYASQYQQFVTMQAECDENAKEWSRSLISVTSCRKLQTTSTDTPPSQDR